jgi:hypothetical protein
MRVAQDRFAMCETLVMPKAPAISATTRKITAHFERGGIVPSIEPMTLTCKAMFRSTLDLFTAPDRKTVERLYDLGELRSREMDVLLPS